MPDQTTQDGAPQLTSEQEKLAKERADQGVCITCGQQRWYCGGEYAHLRKQQLDQE